MLVWTGEPAQTSAPQSSPPSTPEATPPTEPASVSLPRQFRPETPAQAEAEGAHPERRQLTVMFCDLAGSTALSERLTQCGHTEDVDLFDHGGLGCIFSWNNEALESYLLCHDSEGEGSEHGLYSAVE